MSSSEADTAIISAISASVGSREGVSDIALAFASSLRHWNKHAAATGQGTAPPIDGPRRRD
ncbi:hypothetical protein GCM10011392_24810 [Wenxinia marina]|nr:hypothetical protein GCM10011392_24810 [Wenxinia marina]